MLCDPVLWNSWSVTNCLCFILLSLFLLVQTGAFFASTIPFIFLAPTEIGDKSMTHTHYFYQLHSQDPLQRKLSHFFFFFVLRIGWKISILKFLFLRSSPFFVYLSLSTFHCKKSSGTNLLLWNFAYKSPQVIFNSTGNKFCLPQNTGAHSSWGGFSVCLHWHIITKTAFFSCFQ